MARVVFMGTPEFAVPILRALEGAEQVVGVVTQPDRRAGRGRKLVMSPVKEAAMGCGLPLFQPESLRAEEAVARLAGWAPEVIVVAAFGQILRRPVLELPAHGCLNVHASLLPRHRGAAPIPAAILAGDEVSGVTIMRMDEGLDTGPIVAQAACCVRPEDTTGSLAARLAALGAGLVVDVLPEWLGGRIEARAQDEARATTCSQVSKEDGRLDWGLGAVEIERRVRAYDPWPGAYTTWRGQRLKVLRARPVAGWPGAGRPGEVVGLGAEGLVVATGAGAVELVEVQAEGKRPVGAGAFARGQRDLLGGVLGG